jgi:hypothetical protein
MRALRVVGLDESGEFVVCQDTERGERFRVPADADLQAAAFGEGTRVESGEENQDSPMRPREIQARIRAGESVEQVAAAASMPLARVERFAYPVLLERSNTTDLAQRAHPVREDGPDVSTLAEVAANAFAVRGQDYECASWNSWRGDDGRWVVQLNWRAGHSDNSACWAYAPGAHGGTVHPLDQRAAELLDPNPTRSPRGVHVPAGRGRAEPEFLGQEPPEQAGRAAEFVPHGDPLLAPPVELVGYGEEPRTDGAEATEAAQLSEAPGQAPGAEDSQPQQAAPSSQRSRNGKPSVPAWEDVLLGVRSSR